MAAVSVTSINRDEYCNLDGQVDSSSPTLKFQVVQRPGEVTTTDLVPITYFNKTKTKYLRPPEEYQSNKVRYSKWKSTHFERHYFARSTWLEVEAPFKFLLKDFSKKFNSFITKCLRLSPFVSDAAN
jgi:hypothetical protein